MVRVKKERMNISLSPRLKRRVSELAQDRHVSMNDVIEHAIRDHIDRADFSHQNNEFLMERLGQMFNMLINIQNELRYRKDD